MDRITIELDRLLRHGLTPIDMTVTLGWERKLKQHEVPMAIGRALGGECGDENALDLYYSLIDAFENTVRSGQWNAERTASETVAKYGVWESVTCLRDLNASDRTVPECQVGQLARELRRVLSDELTQRLDVCFGNWKRVGHFDVIAQRRDALKAKHRRSDRSLNATAAYTPPGKT